MRNDEARSNVPTTDQTRRHDRKRLRTYEPPLPPAERPGIKLPRYDTVQ